MFFLLFLMCSALNLATCTYTNIVNERIQSRLAVAYVFNAYIWVPHNSILLPTKDYIVVDMPTIYRIGSQKQNISFSCKAEFKGTLQYGQLMLNDINAQDKVLTNKDIMLIYWKYNLMIHTYQVFGQCDDFKQMKYDQKLEPLPFYPLMPKLGESTDFTQISRLAHRLYQDSKTKDFSITLDDFHYYRLTSKGEIKLISDEKVYGYYRDVIFELCYLYNTTRSFVLAIANPLQDDYLIFLVTSERHYNSNEIKTLKFKPMRRIEIDLQSINEICKMEINAPESSQLQFKDKQITIYQRSMNDYAIITKVKGITQAITINGEVQIGQKCPIYSNKLNEGNKTVIILIICAIITFIAIQAVVFSLYKWCN